METQKSLTLSDRVLVDTSTVLVLFVDKDCIWVKVCICADTELSEDGSRHGHSNIVHLELLSKEVVSCVEVQLVYELDLLCSCTGCVGQVSDLRLEVVSERETETGCLAFAWRRSGTHTLIYVVILSLDDTVPVSICQGPVTIEICSLFRAERC